MIFKANVHNQSRLFLFWKTIGQYFLINLFRVTSPYCWALFFYFVNSVCQKSYFSCCVNIWLWGRKALFRIIPIATRSGLFLPTVPTSCADAFQTGRQVFATLLYMMRHIIIYGALLSPFPYPLLVSRPLPLSLRNRFYSAPDCCYSCRSQLCSPSVHVRLMAVPSIVLWSQESIQRLSVLYHITINNLLLCSHYA